MIKIIRDDCPPRLRNNPQRGKRYNHEKVVDALWTMQHKKCCYCERSIPAKGQGSHVDHFRPRSQFPHLLNQWENLLLSCPQCNGNKNEDFPIDSRGNPRIIDPSDPKRDPESYITFDVNNDADPLFGKAIRKNRSRLGHKTIEVMKLGTRYYTDMRKRYYLDTIMPLYTNLLEAKQEDNAEGLQEYRERFERKMSARTKFSAFVREFARQKQLDQYLQIKIPVGSKV